MSEVTWAACLTPPGAGAIATIAVRGPRAWNVAQSLFRFQRAGAALPALDASLAGRFWLGRFGVGVADEVVLSVRRVAPAPWLEIHGHGGSEAVRLLLETLAAQHVQICSWQDLEQKTAADPLRAAIAAELVKAATPRTAAILLDQYHGAFGRALAEVRAVLDRQDVARGLTLLEGLARWTALGRHLTMPWRVAVIGPPNVGKSSLVNALAGFQRSVVSATPGTTRDVVTTRIAVDGWPIELADTAGLREQAGALEGQGIERARAAASTADLCLWVVDASTTPVWPEDAHVRCIINKVDQPAAWDLGLARDALRVSARSGSGLAELCQALAGWLVPAPPAPGVAVPFTATWCDRIEEARRLLTEGRSDEARSLLESG